MLKGILQHKVIIVIVGLLIALGVWYGLSSSSAPVPLLTTDTPTNAPGQDLVETLLALRAVNLDGTIFTESAFMGLQDYSTPIVPEPVGRTNPFAPLRFSSSPIASSTKEAHIFSPTGGQKIPTSKNK